MSFSDIFNSFKRGIHVDATSFQQNRVSRILGHDQPLYIHPHVQWHNHVSNLQQTVSNNLIKVGRYRKLRMK